VNRRPNSVTPSIPKNTAVPSDRRISAPAPVATASGTTLFERLEHREDRAFVGSERQRCSVEAGKCGGRVNARRGGQDLVHLARHGVGSDERGAGRQLKDRDETALVELWDEAGGGRG
jgi:hypothetical protein